MAASGDIYREISDHIVASQNGSHTYAVVPSGQGVARNICLYGQMTGVSSVLADIEVQLIIDAAGKSQDTIETFFGKIGTLDPEFDEGLGLFWDAAGAPLSITGFITTRIPFDASFSIKVINTNINAGAAYEMTMKGCRVEYALF